MRIALISEHASPLALLGGNDAGGQNVYVAQLARRLGAMGHLVDVFTRRDDPALPTIARLGFNARVIHIDAGPPAFVPKEELLPFMEAFSEGIVEHARATSYDVSHANFFMSGLASLRLKRELGLPFVITFHALGRVRRLHQREADRFPLARERIEDALVAGADRIIAECPQDRFDLIEHYMASFERINIVPCGFDEEELGPTDASLRGEYGLEANDFVVLQLGRMVPRKGVDNVVRGIAELRRAFGVTAKLLIAGGNHDRPDPVAPEMARLRDIARDEGVDGQVIFTGRCARERLRHVYGAANVFVTTPWYEPFGITPLEAMACGLPVIGAAVGGIKYSVIDHVTGFLVPPNDPPALANRLARLYRSPAQAAAFGRAGLLRARRMFTWQRVALSLSRVYAGVAAPHRAARRAADAR